MSLLLATDKEEYINLEDNYKIFNDEYGDVFTLGDFIDECECGSIIDSDGIVGGILLNGYIIKDGWMYVSDVIDNIRLLKKLQKIGKVDIVWYNK